MMWVTRQEAAPHAPQRIHQTPPNLDPGGELFPPQIGGGDFGKTMVLQHAKNGPKTADVLRSREAGAEDQFQVVCDTRIWCLDV